MGRPPEERMLQLLDELCLDSLEGLASEQKPEHGEISARFHELRGLVLARGRVIEAQRKTLQAVNDNALAWGEDGKARALNEIAGWTTEALAGRVHSSVELLVPAALAAGGEIETPAETPARCTRPSAKWCLDRNCPIHGSWLGRNR